MNAAVFGLGAFAVLAGTAVRRLLIVHRFWRLGYRCRNGSSGF